MHCDQLMETHGETNVDTKPAEGSSSSNPILGTDKRPIFWFLDKNYATGQATLGQTDVLAQHNLRKDYDVIKRADPALPVVVGDKRPFPDIKRKYFYPKGKKARYIGLMSLLDGMPPPGDLPDLQQRILHIPLHELEQAFTLEKGTMEKKKHKRKNKTQTAQQAPQATVPETK